MTPSNDPIEQTRETILRERVILCVRLNESQGLEAICRAALRGGLRVLEITLTTPGALGLIETLAGEDGVLVGAGTVLDAEDARRVAGAGARFAMSPVFDAEMVAQAHRLGMLAVPGAATSTEILYAHRHGAKLVKVFPAGALGGAAFLRAVRGPLPDIGLVPTSGPSTETLAGYFAAGAVAVGVGGEVIKPGSSLEEVEAAARRVRAAADVLG